MAKAARQAVTIHYRRLEDVTGAFGTQTFEDAVRKAMNHHFDGGKVADHWKRRAWLVPPSSEDTLLMNLSADGETYYFGDLTHYTKGYLQTLLAEEADTPSLAVEQQPPPKGKEFVHSMMYWLVTRNHLLMIQSRSLAAKQLEEYLTWLLKDRTTAIGPTGQVILQAKFDAAEVGGDLDDIKEIIVGGKAASAGIEDFSDAGAASRTIEKHQDLATRRPWGKRAWDVLRAAMNNEADVRELMESIPEGADLEVAVHIGYKAKKKISRAPMQHALRNLPEGEITAVGRNGKQSGKDIRLSHPASVLKVGNILDPGDVVRALREAHQFFVDNGKIET
ncbi:MAG: hypothetical protein H7316_10490 [Tardiphaga sp.]|uniref:hypothetical protein n=1 Tax=Tardiphaga sp. TaxID=1926292 RepID=UPI001982D261|nr:hypothetical protein [Tardiphaga sp.]MBC7584164.1 hypothetical protein [Tardiphaga sp.]